MAIVHREVPRWEQISADGLVQLVSILLICCSAEELLPHFVEFYPLWKRQGKEVVLLSLKAYLNQSFDFQSPSDVVYFCATSGLKLVCQSSVRWFSGAYFGFCPGNVCVHGIYSFPAPLLCLQLDYCFS